MIEGGKDVEKDVRKDVGKDVGRLRQLWSSVSLLLEEGHVVYYG